MRDSRRGAHQHAEGRVTPRRELVLVKNMHPPVSLVLLDPCQKRLQRCRRGPRVAVRAMCHIVHKLRRVTKLHVAHVWRYGLTSSGFVGPSRIWSTRIVSSSNQSMPASKQKKTLPLVCA
eukprot:6176548-Pleurochrysis_carterae.AAC.1